MAKAFATLLFLSIALIGCGTGENEHGPGGVSADDAKALDEAAAKLDAQGSNQPE